LGIKPTIRASKFLFRDETLRRRLIKYGFVVLTLSAFVPLLTAATPTQRVIVIEDWKAHAVGRKGVPSGWTSETFGRTAAYDLTVEQIDEIRFLHLISRDEHSIIAKDISNKVNLKDAPILEWSWKATILPTGGDLRQKETTDMAAQIYVVWPRFPALLRSRIIGYVWDTATPAGTVILSQKTGTVTFVVARSGPQDLGKWITERRNIVQDYLKIYGEFPPDPKAITISIDSNDTHSVAESFIGPIVFRAE